MPSKFLSNNSASRLEAEWEDGETTPMLTMADTIVNPIWQHGLVCKRILINLPGIKLGSLARRNKVISRFPLESEDDTELKYELVPYEDVEFQNNPELKPYSRHILNKYMLMNENVKVNDGDRFLLGTDSIIGGELSLVGYLLIKTIKS